MENVKVSHSACWGKERNPVTFVIWLKEKKSGREEKTLRWEKKVNFVCFF